MSVVWVLVKSSFFFFFIHVEMCWPALNNVATYPFISAFPSRDIMVGVGYELIYRKSLPEGSRAPVVR